MLSNQAIELVERIEYKKTLLEEKKNLQAFNTRKNQLQALRQSIVSIYKTHQALIQKGIAVADFNGQLADVVRKLQEVQQKFTDEPGWVKDPEALIQLQRKIEKLIRDMSGNFLIVWKEYILKLVPSLNKDTLKILEKIPAFKKTTQDIDRMYQQIEQEIGKLPKSEQDIIQMEVKCKELRDKWGQLGADDVPPDVLTFLRHTGTQRGASLSMLTAEVISWLEQHQISQFVSVRIM